MPSAFTTTTIDVFNISLQHTHTHTNTHMLKTVSVLRTCTFRVANRNIDNDIQTTHSSSTKAGTSQDKICKCFFPIGEKHFLMSLIYTIQPPLCRESRMVVRQHAERQGLMIRIPTEQSPQQHLGHIEIQKCNGTIATARI